jgi:hypothetical protein
MFDIFFEVSKKLLLIVLSFENLCVNLCDPLWFRDLYFTTKDSKGLTKVHQGLFKQPQVKKGVFI